jgi:hypothetical protein
MDALVSVLAQFSTAEKLAVLGTTVVLILVLAFLFRRPIADLIDNIRSIEFDPKKRRLKLEFGQRIRQEQRKATAIPREVTGNSRIPAPMAPRNGAKHAGRDLVLPAWGALKQAVYDACIENGMTITPSLNVPEAARKLALAQGLPMDLVTLIESLYELGRGVAGDGGLRPSDEDAEAYANLAYNAAHWLALSTLGRPAPPPPPPSPPAPQRRATVVGGGFAPPAPRPADTALVAVAGPLKGQRFAIDKSSYRLGRSPSNDLCAKADDAVSGHHASVRHENGGWFLYDHGSLNGTFLNEQRLAGAPVMIRHGDRIRLGESVFEVVAPSARASSGEAQDEVVRGPDRSVVL